MIRRLASIPGFVFGVVVVWKFSLLAFFAQSIPLSDSFFYDGAVVNLLNGAGYCNPSLEIVLPISATQVFSAYPPLYQGVLWLWMSVFGTGVGAAMWLHFALFVAYGLAGLAVLREVGTPAGWVNFGSLFLFGITFQDRPDSLALGLGCWALYAWLRARRAPGGAWCWLAVGLNVLALATGLQIGLACLAWCWGLVLAQSWIHRQSVPWLPLGISVLVPAALVLGVRCGAPQLWAGFQEHVAQTPTLLGWHVENSVGLLKSHLFKLARTAPGILFAFGCFGWWWIRVGRSGLANKAAIFLAVTFGVVACLIFAATVLLMPNVILWLAYLQPLIVALTLMLWALPAGPARGSPCLTCVFGLLALVVAIRAIGISTWGVACSLDLSQAESERRVQQVIAATPRGDTMVFSAPFLYEANRHREVRSLHVDWLSSFRKPVNLTQRLTEIRPVRLVLSQFDWYRSFESIVADLRRRTEVDTITVTNTAGRRPPDAFPKMQRILQHISWAPVIVELSWKPVVPQPTASPAAAAGAVPADGR